MEPNACTTCQPGHDALSFLCHACSTPQHFHHSSVSEQARGSIIVVSCPGCQRPNAVRVPSRKAPRGMPVASLALQPALAPDSPKARR